MSCLVLRHIHSVLICLEYIFQVLVSWLVLSRNNFKTFFLSRLVSSWEFPVPTHPCYLDPLNHFVLKRLLDGGLVCVSNFRQVLLERLIKMKIDCKFLANHIKPNDVRSAHYIVDFAARFSKVLFFNPDNKTHFGFLIRQTPLTLLIRQTPLTLKLCPACLVRSAKLSRQSQPSLGINGHDPTLKIFTLWDLHEKLYKICIHQLVLTKNFKNGHP